MEDLRLALAQILRARMQMTLALNTQTRVSNKSDLAQSTIQRILKSEQAATVDVIAQLADAFGVRPARYFLLEKDEADLLTGFARLDAQDRQKLMTYLDIAGQAKFVQDARAQLNFSQERPVPADLIAATERASARAPTVNTSTANVTPTRKHKEKRNQA